MYVYFSIFKYILYRNNPRNSYEMKYNNIFKILGICYQIAFQMDYTALHYQCILLQLLDQVKHTPSLMCESAIYITLIYRMLS